MNNSQIASPAIAGTGWRTIVPRLTPSTAHSAAATVPPSRSRA